MASESKITFKYIYQDDYNPVYVNGAHGGINVQGEIIANFYFERIPMPYKITNEVNNEGVVGEIMDTDPKDLSKSIVRYVQSGIVMNLEVAKQVYDWLGKQIALRESQMKVQK